MGWQRQSKKRQICVKECFHKFHVKQFLDCCNLAPNKSIHYPSGSFIRELQLKNVSSFSSTLQHSELFQQCLKRMEITIEVVFQGWNLLAVEQNAQSLTEFWSEDSFPTRFWIGWQLRRKIVHTLQNQFIAVGCVYKYKTIITSFVNIKQWNATRKDLKRSGHSVKNILWVSISKYTGQENNWETLAAH